jgi:formate hydrogenlyase subunit 4
MLISPYRIISFVIVLFVAPALPGIAARTRAILTRRRGPPVLQLYSDVSKLVRRGTVYSSTTTWIFRLAPVAVLSTALIAAILLPFDGESALFSFSGDVVAFVYALGFGRLILVLAALDTGSSFEGMGASREVTVAAFVEVGFFLSLAVLSLVTGELSLSGMLAAPASAVDVRTFPPLAMVAGSLFAMMLADAARVPVDDPTTHLELTMIHEVMVLDHSGPDLALLLYGGALRLTLFAAIIVGVLIPRASLTAGVSTALMIGGLALVGVGIGVVESVMARFRWPRVPLYLAGGSALALFSLVLLVWGSGA